jgi:hypothetical protein
MIQKRYLLVELARSAIEAGEIEHPERGHFNCSVRGPPTRDWNYGNAIHHGHIILGRIALFVR